MNLEPPLHSGIKKFKSLLKKTRKNTSPENVHDLRVITRRLRADFWLIPKAQRTEAIRKARRDLRRLCQVLGEQRKYDVALEDALHFGRKTDEIERAGRAARKEAKATLRSKKSESYVDNLRNALRDIRRISPNEFFPRIEILRHQLDRTQRKTPTSSTARHHLRIRVKRARYLLEAFRHKVPPLKTLQDHLGRWHDLTVLSTLCGHPKNVIDAKERQWRLAERRLRTTLRQTSATLAATVKEARLDS